MKRMIIIIVIVLASAISGISNNAAMDIPLLSKPPVIDGRLAPGEWAGTLPFADFQYISKYKVVVSPGLRTEAYMGRTAEALWFAFRCYHDQLSLLRTAETRHDGNVWTDDSVELFLDTRGTRADYYHVIANMAGVVYDAYNKVSLRDVTWDSGAETAGQLLEDGFIIEVMVPLSSLNLGLNTTQAINMNICRNVSCGGWNQARFGKYHVPASWQAFRLPGMGPESYPLVLEKGEWSPLAGENEMMVRIRNMTGKPVELAGTLAVAQGKEQQAPAVRAEMLAGGTTELRVPYSVKELETVHFKLSLRNDKQREVFSAHRILDPKPIAAVEVDSDILERGENPSLTVTLNVTRAAAPNYGVRLVARTLDGKEICSRDISAAGQTQIHETLDISKVPPKTSALEIETFVTDTKSQREVLRVKTPLRIVPSPWNNEGI